MKLSCGALTDLKSDFQVHVLGANKLPTHVFALGNSHKAAALEDGSGGTSMAKVKRQDCSLLP